MFSINYTDMKFSMVNTVYLLISSFLYYVRKNYPEKVERDLTYNKNISLQPFTRYK